MSSEIIDDDIWQARVSQYRDEPAIEQAILTAKKKAFKPDTSLVSELHNSFPYLREQEENARTIRGPADLNRGLAVSAELQAIKDRAAEITLRYDNIRGKLERLHDIVRTNVFLKKEVMFLKNDPQRLAVVSMTCPEIEDRLAGVKRILSAAETVTKNVNQSYNILKLQIDIVREMMYEGGLAKAMRGGDRS
jgi:hypothetical protein